MNEKDREQLKKIAVALDALKGKVETLRDDEQEKFDNLSEGLQQGEKGQQIEAAVQSLSEAADSLDSAINSIEEIE